MVKYSAYIIICSRKKLEQNSIRAQLDQQYKVSHKLHILHIQPDRDKGNILK